MIQIIKSLKSLKSNPMLIFVNIPGLAIALAAFLLLMIYVQHELNYDQFFPTKDRVLRLYNQIDEENSSSVYPICMRVAYTEIPQQIPEIEKACQINNGWKQILDFNDQKFRNCMVYYVDPEFFDVFGLSTIRGNKQDALLGKFKLVLTDELALKVFSTTDCVGKIVELDGEEYTISAVMEKLPKTSHLQFDILCSMESIPLMYMDGLEFFTYYLLKEQVDLNEAGAKISSAYNVPLNELFNSFNASGESGLEPLSQLHMHTKADWDLSRKGSVSNIILIATLAAFILAIAIFNFINLYVYHGEKRILEIGIRKTLGASKQSLRRLFYAETTLLTAMALFIALIITSAALPFFSDLVQTNLTLNEIFDPLSVGLILFFSFIFILIAGSYPAFYLSELNVSDAVKGGIKFIRRRKWLVVASVFVQFFISSLLIVSLLVINAQIRFVKNKDIGFEAQEVITINGFEKDISSKVDAIKEELLKLNFVSTVGSSSHSMGGGCSGQSMHIYGQAEESAKGINEYRVQPGFCETMQLQLLSGRFFKANEQDKNAIILNESGAKYFGLKEPLETSFIMNGDEPLQVIGIVKDFVYSHSGKKIEPLVMTAYSQRVSNVYLKIIGEWNKEKQNAIASVFMHLLPDYSLNTKKLNDIYLSKFASENRLNKILSSAAFLAIIMSFIGMYAFSIFNVEKRTKEIGIRKVNGSTSQQILWMILKDILKWVVFAMIPAFLVSIIYLNHFLSDYAYHIDLSIWYFLVAALLSIFIAILATSIKSIKAANQNPVVSLRYE